MVAAAHSWSAVQQGWQQQGCEELVADHRLMDAGTIRRGSGRCFEGDLANLAKGVVAAARELASDGDESDVGV